MRIFSTETQNRPVEHTKVLSLEVLVYDIYIYISYIYIYIYSYYNFHETYTFVFVVYETRGTT